MMARGRSLVEELTADHSLSEADRQQIQDFAVWLRAESKRQPNPAGDETDMSAVRAEEESSE